MEDIELVLKFDKHIFRIIKQRKNEYMKKHNLKELSNNEGL